jgi:asparagine synthase (glutamine-hydrolysing)
VPPFGKGWLRLYTLAGRDRCSMRVAHTERFFRERIFSSEAARGMPPPEASLLRIFNSAEADTILDRWSCGDLMGRMQQNMVIFPDITGMAYSLEIRAPLLDHKLVEFAASLPADLRLRNGRVGKYVLREAVRPLLPAEVFDRPKRGFSGASFEQLVRCCRGEWKQPFSELLFEGRPWLSDGLFQEDGVRAVWDVLQNGPADSPRTLRCFQMTWMLLSVRMWENQARELLSEAGDQEGNSA